MGTFWPGGTAAVNATEYRVRIIGVNRTYKGSKGKTVAFKVQQMQPDDPNGTGPATLQENVNYWWVEKDALRPVPRPRRQGGGGGGAYQGHCGCGVGRGRGPCPRQAGPPPVGVAASLRRDQGHPGGRKGRRPGRDLAPLPRPQVRAYRLLRQYQSEF